MGENCNWPCWKIMNCDASQDCVAKSHPETPCWEIAGELNDYRHALDICRDCIVYMLKTDDSNLTRQEMETIMTQRANCALA
jgi:hypothetical protein